MKHAEENVGRARPPNPHFVMGNGRGEKTLLTWQRLFFMLTKKRRHSRNVPEYFINTEIEFN